MGKNRPCRDRCFEWPTIVKWLIYAGVFGYLYIMVSKWNTEQANKFMTGAVVLQTNFHINCLVCALMHPIFMVARIPIFFIYAIFTCCCDKGEDLNDAFNYEKLIISYGYVESHQ